MYCILNPSIALRSWTRIPYAIVHKDAIKVIPVDKEVFHILECCDGKTEISYSKEVHSLLRSGIIKCCRPNEAALDPWQYKRQYENRCFPAVLWSITEQCNFNCRHCFVGTGSNKDAPFFQLHEAKEFLRAAEQCGIHAIAITGGEPLMHPHFVDIIEEIYRRSMQVFMINTNGALITPALLKRMRSIGCVPQMKISFDGVGWHNWLRRDPDAERMTKQAIELCVAEGFPVTVQTNVHPGNIDSLNATILYLEKVGVKQMRLIRTADTVKWKEDCNGDVLSFSEYFDSMIRLVETFRRQEHSIELDIWRFLMLKPSQKQYRITAIRHGHRDFSDQLPVCEGNRNMMSVAADGEVYPCHPFSDFFRHQGVSLGNVKKQQLGAILSHGSYMNSVCETLEQLLDHNPCCGRCRYFRYCCGGCRAMATLYGGDYNAPDPMMCTFFHNKYDLKIHAVLKGWKNLMPEEI